MESPKIILSIIVPIYGVERYLRKCVDSLLAQDIDNYEIILVDDGSPDECPQICDEYAKRAKSQELRVKSLELRAKSISIHVIHRENGGLSAARNSGIEAAQGKYIMFVDSDDYLEPNVLGKLVKRMEDEELDVLRFDYQNVNEQGAIIHPYKDPKRNVDYSESVTDGETFLNERLGAACYAWQFVIKSVLLRDCLFKEGIYFEDTEWAPRMSVKAKRVASTPLIAYNYLWRTGSITLPTDPVKRKKLIEDKILLLRGFKEQRKLVRDPVWFTWMTSFNTMSILDMLAQSSVAERKEYLSELRSLNVFPLSTDRANRNGRIKIRLANINPLLYCKLMSLWI